MANVLGELFQKIADAIREQTGETGTMKPADFPGAILGIEAGSDITLIDNIDITPDFSLGNQFIVAQEGYAVKGATILKPETLIPENIAEGVEIAGVVGTMAGGSSNDVRYVTFMNGDTVLYKKPVAVGDDCVDVLTKGLISTPTKESTVQYTYGYLGWGASDNGAVDSNILKNITEDKTVYAIYTSTLRKYTITYLDDDGITVLHTEQVAYSSVPSYKPEKDGFVFAGWAEELVAVVGDATYTATWDVDNGVEIYNKTFNATTNDGNYGAYGGLSVPLGSGPVFEAGDTIIATVDGTEYEFVAYETKISSSQGSKTFHCIGNVKVLKKHLGYTASYTVANYTNLNFFIGIDLSSTKYVAIYFTAPGSHAITLLRR